MPGCRSRHRDDATRLEASAAGSVPAPPLLDVVPPPSDIPTDPAAAYALLDERLREGFDYETKHLRFWGTVKGVAQLYGASAGVANQWREALDRVAKSAEPKWATLAVARQGSVYDSLRESLVTLKPPQVELFTRDQEQQLRLAETGGQPDVRQKAAEVRQKVKASWDSYRTRELESVELIIVNRYATALGLAEANKLSLPELDRAAQRLAELEKAIGVEKMTEYTKNVPHFSWRPTMPGAQ